MLYKIIFTILLPLSLQAQPNCHLTTKATASLLVCPQVTIEHAQLDQQTLYMNLIFSDEFQLELLAQEGHNQIELSFDQGRRLQPVLTYNDRLFVHQALDYLSQNDKLQQFALLDIFSPAMNDDEVFAQNFLFSGEVPWPSGKKPGKIPPNDENKKP